MIFKGHHGLCQELILGKCLSKHLAHHAYGNLFKNFLLATAASYHTSLIYTGTGQDKW